MSIENPTDADEYLEDILNNLGMELDKDLREEMVKELNSRTTPQAGFGQG